MNNNELFQSWINLTKYYDRILKAMDYKLHHQFQMGVKEFYLLYYLKQGEGQRMKLSDLVPKVGLSHSALSRLVTRLENFRNGALVERKSSNKDKRSVDVILKGEGAKLMKEMEILINETLQQQLVEKDIINIKKLVE